MGIERDLIFDVGMHFGEDTEFYLKHGCRVLAIEANPILAEAGRQRFSKEVEQRLLEILNIGIHHTEGSADFWICESHPEWSSFDRAIASRDGAPHRCVKVRTIRFRNILEERGTPYYLKIDIEGNDLLCLQDLSSSSLPQYLSLESECFGDHEIGTAEDGLAALRELRDLGYTQFKLINQRTFASLAVPKNPSHWFDDLGQRLRQPPFCSIKGLHRLSRLLLQRRRLARRLGWGFPPGSSGPWGEDTPGKWIHYEQAMDAYEYYRELHFSRPTARVQRFWCDWHAKL